MERKSSILTLLQDFIIYPLALIADVLENDKSKLNRVFRYTSLPAELRTQILRHVLSPHEIHPHPNPWINIIAMKDKRYLNTVNQEFPLGFGKSELEFLRQRHREIYKIIPNINHPSINKNISPKQGPQLLAACHETYDDGYRMFYSQNTFCLPPGPLEISLQYFDNLQPHENALIQSVRIDLGIADLTRSVLETIEQELHVTYQPRMHEIPLRLQQVIWEMNIRRRLQDLWGLKIWWVIRSQDLREVKLVGIDRGMLLRRQFRCKDCPPAQQSRKQFWESAQSRDADSVVLTLLVKTTAKYVMARVNSKVREVGIDGTKRWILRGARD